MTPTERTRAALRAIEHYEARDKLIDGLPLFSQRHALRECVRLVECWDRLKNLGTTTLSEGILWSHLLLKMRHMEKENSAPLWRDELGVRRGK
jgi:hypothetical protein